MVPYVLSILLGAFLLFGSQPFAARVLLPAFGGSPAVWNTCLVFFQCLLLLGYLYAHAITRLGRWQRTALHVVVVLLPLALLPPHLELTAAPAQAWPVPRLLGALFLLLGPMFFVLSTNSTLVQWWYARRGHGDPYFLYAASNTGSLVALLAYPLLLEPALGLGEQGTWLTLGYLVFALLTLGLLARSWGAEGASSSASGPAPPSPPPRRRNGWVLRSAVGSSLLLGVSLQITTDLAPNPLLWVVPLALYLLSFIIAFGVERLPRRALTTATALVVVLALGRQLLGIAEPSWLVLSLPLATLFLGCLVLHGDLASSRPAPQHLTAFYLWISLGGFLGGFLANLVAPMIFDRVAEYPLALLLLVVLLREPGDWGRWRADLRSPAALAFLLLLLGWAATLIWGWSRHASQEDAVLELALCLPLVLGLLVRRRVGLLELAVGSAVVLAWVGMPSGGQVLAVERSFFGVSRVVQEGDLRRLMHGTTMHGSQFTRGDAQHDPSSYYHPHAPMGQAMTVQPPGARIGVVGLGAGSIAALGKAGQHIVFYEIDPLVEQLAREYFSFLADSPAQVEVRLGDARVTLQTEAPGDYDLLILDAFSSDAVPLHLLSREAIQLYLRHLAPQGVLLAHISNRHLDLLPVFRDHARSLRLAGVTCFYHPTHEERTQGAWASQVVALSRSAASLGDLPQCWQPLTTGRSVRWTDDHAGVWMVMR